MRRTLGLSPTELRFGALISSVHAVQHLFYRLVPPLIPLLVVDLDSPLWQLGALVSVYMFTGGLFQAPMGNLSDSFNREKILVFSIGFMSVGYLVFAGAPLLGGGVPVVELFEYRFTGTYQLMVLGMALAGVGYSGIHPVGYPLISANVAPENKGKVLGMWGSASKVGDAVAPVVVGALVLVTPWQWILVGVALFGFAYAAGLYAVLRSGPFETRPPSASSDATGAPDADWRTRPRAFLLPMAVLVLFFLCLLFAGNGLLTFAPLFVSEVYGYSAVIAGVTVGPESVGNFYFAALLVSAALAQLASGALADRYDYRAVIVSCLGVATIGLAILATATLSPLTLLVAFVVVGGCIFGLNPVRDALISDLSPDEYEGRTFGYLYTIALVGSSAFPAVIGYLGDAVGVQASFGALAIGTVFAAALIGLLYSSAIYQAESADATAG